MSAARHATLPLICVSQRQKLVAITRLGRHPDDAEAATRVERVTAAHEPALTQRPQPVAQRLIGSPQRRVRLPTGDGIQPRDPDPVERDRPGYRKRTIPHATIRTIRRPA